MVGAAINPCSGSCGSPQPTHNLFLQLFFPKQRKVLDAGQNQEKEQKGQTDLPHARRAGPTCTGVSGKRNYRAERLSSCVESRSLFSALHLVAVHLRSSDNQSLDFWSCHFCINLLPRPKDKSILKHISLGTQYWQIDRVGMEGGRNSHRFCSTVSDPTQCSHGLACLSDIGVWES